MKPLRGIIGYRIIVILLAALFIVALLLISLLYKGTYPVSTLSDGKALCSMQAKLTCNRTARLPTSWNSRNIRLGIQTLSCSELMKCNNCAACLP